MPCTTVIPDDESVPAASQLAKCSSETGRPVFEPGISAAAPCTRPPLVQDAWKLPSSSRSRSAAELPLQVSAAEPAQRAAAPVLVPQGTCFGHARAG